MDKPKTVIAALSDDMAERLDAAVEAGEYYTTGEIVREALANWAEDQDRKSAALARLRAMIDEGLASESLPAEEVFADLRRLVTERVQRSLKDAA